MPTVSDCSPDTTKWCSITRGTGTGGVASGGTNVRYSGLRTYEGIQHTGRVVLAAWYLIRRPHTLRGSRTTKRKQWRIQKVLYGIIIVFNIKMHPGSKDLGVITAIIIIIVYCVEAVSSANGRLPRPLTLWKCRSYLDRRKLESRGIFWQPL